MKMKEAIIGICLMIVGVIVVSIPLFLSPDEKHAIFSVTGPLAFTLFLSGIGTLVYADSFEEVLEEENGD